MFNYQQSYLSKKHRNHLKEEGFSDKQIDKLVSDYQIKTLTEEYALKSGFRVRIDGKYYSSSGILLPLTSSFAQLRCDIPIQLKNGKSIRYLTQSGRKAEAFLPENCRVITEGFKDAISGTWFGGITTGAIAGVSHYRKALECGSGLTIVFDSDGWINPQVFAQLLHAGNWLNGSVQLLPKIEGYPKAGLCEYFKVGYTSEDYQRLLDTARKPSELLLEWPNYWESQEASEIVRLARTASCLASIFLPAEEANAFCRRIASQYYKAGIRQNELYRFSKKLRERRQKNRYQTNYQKEHNLIANKLGRYLAWNKLSQQPEFKGKPFKLEKVKVFLAIENSLPLKSNRSDLIDSVEMISKVNSFHPIKCYLQQVVDSKVEELSSDPNVLDSLAERYFGNPDPIAQIFLKKTLIAAVARIFEPGCKVDTVTVLVGDQGINKSQFWKTLAGEDWFCDDFSDVDSKDHLLKLHEAWIIEWPELHGLTRKESNRIKSFITTERDRIRKPYAREAEWLPRPSILVGSSNDSDFLTDATGNRRWWIIRVYQRIDISSLQKERDLIWAAAVKSYCQNEPWWLSNAEEASANLIRKGFEDLDPWHENVEDYLDNKERVSISEIFEAVLDIGSAYQDKKGSNRIVNILKRSDWKRIPNPVQHNGKKQRVWERSQHLGKKSPKNTVPSVPECQSVAEESPASSNTRSSSESTTASVPSREKPSSNNPSESEVSADGVPDKSYTQQDIHHMRNSGTIKPSTDQTFPESSLFHVGDSVTKKFKRGWVGIIQSDPKKGQVYVTWSGDQQPSLENTSDLKLKS
ncbi:VapE domain-containing protein [Acaryochloris marina NIES-2412]|uniref:VapE domain-containing protein n=1 Tax=Acaryochloris marina TaxID=155978 RepID=UPI0040597727